MTKTEVENLVKTYLAPNQPIRAVGMHQPSMQVLIDQLFNAQESGNLLSTITGNILAINSGDKFLLFRGGIAYLVDKSLVGSGGGGGTGGIGHSVQNTGVLNFTNLPQFVFKINVLSPLTISHLNGSIAENYDLILNITSTSNTLTFPTGYLMNDLRWSPDTRVFQSPITGLFKGRAVFDQTNWLLSIEQGSYAAATGGGGGSGVFDDSFDNSFN